MIDHNNPEITFAIDAVRQAARLVQDIQAQMVSAALSKDDRSPVTVADFAAQALIGNLLASTFGQALMIAEEDSNALRAPGAAKTLEQVTNFLRSRLPEADEQKVCAWIDHGRTDSAARFWTLDPIDGTKGFLRGDHYAVALALVEDGQVVVGALGCPNLTDAAFAQQGGPGSLIVAARDQGAWTTALDKPGDYKPLQVSGRSDSRQARVLRSFESGHTNVSQIDRFAQALAVEAQPVRMDSQAKYALLAAGAGDLMLRLLSPSKPNYREKIWDQAAGSIILEEAGGMITDLDGRPLDFTTGRKLVRNRGILASNKHFHAVALQALAAIGA